ncbi:DNA polymerase epsilon subunit D [Neolecta irregularis DAH-3]|uniref:DNA polymerase epsilon subunit D n=1 Tax=Neolecta irregularis (strain DAH-3) TaxID=1198029 RepID=A0A1U7LM58_NEOID|nr:DNA polymerase epsilon subunit D [Neolecta irregularis DAH-3]|eukprot:OLL23632.1 DNA polymerase epsilon subunit D [Neolecta irregularis DAH-3]
MCDNPPIMNFSTSPPGPMSGMAVSSERGRLETDHELPQAPPESQLPDSFFPPPPPVQEIAEPLSGKKTKESRSKVSVEDFNLPKTIVTRLAKGVLPDNTSLQKDSVLALQKAATVFINYIASTANDNTTSSGKKTITPQDVLRAMEIVELGQFVPALEKELKVFTQITSEKRAGWKKNAKEKAGFINGDTSPPTKKLKIDEDNALNGCEDVDETMIDMPEEDDESQGEESVGEEEETAPVHDMQRVEELDAERGSDRDEALDEDTD